jgi:hypothetical protein
MSAKQFVQSAQEDPQLRVFLKEIAERASNASKESSIEEPQQYITVTAVDILITIAAYALYRWLKDNFDRRRALNEAEIVEEQTRITAALIRDGFQPKDAHHVTAAMLKEVAHRTADDPIFKMATNRIGN